LEEKVDMDWEDQRRKIFQHFGLSQKDGSTAGDLRSTTRGAFGRSARQSKQAGASQAHHGPAGASRRSVFGRSALDKSVIGTPGTGLASRQLFEDPSERSEGLAASSPDLRFLREKMGHYADKVQDLNVARLQGQAYPILHQFAQVELQNGGDVRPSNSPLRPTIANNPLIGTSAALRCVSSFDPDRS
jgi:nuclear pore complex protein Nup93